MKRIVLSFLLMGVLTLEMAPGAMAHTAMKSVSAKSLALRLSDMPPGYKQTTSRVVSNTETIRSDRSNEYITHGRITGYQTAFSNPNAIALTQVTDSVAIFKSGAGAHWAVGKAASTGTASGLLGKHFRRMSVGRVGDESVGFTVTAKAKGISVTLDTVVFRVGRYAGSIVGAGVTQDFSLHKLLSLAQVIAHRMRAMR